MRKILFIIDGWFMRKSIYKLKSFYYDTEPFDKKAHNPISKNPIDFSKTSVAEHQKALLKSIKRTPNFALRLGRTVWRNNQWILSQEKIKNLVNKKLV